MSAVTGEFALFGTPEREAAPPLSRATWAAAIVIGALATMVWLSGTRSVVAESAAAGAVVSLGRRLSHDRRYFAEVKSVVGPIEVGAVQSWTVRLERRNQRRLAHAAVDVRVTMPETGVQSPIRGTARYVGGGRYRLDGIVFTTPGWWNVELVVNGVAGRDSVAFNAIVPRRFRPTVSGP